MNTTIDLNKLRKNLSVENLTRLRDEAYANAKEKRFHDKVYEIEHWLCLINSELYEAVNAHRSNKRVNIKAFESDSDISEFMKFEVYIKDTVEDELADAVIRILDLMGLQDVAIDTSYNIAYAIDIIDIPFKFTSEIYYISCKPFKYIILHDYNISTVLNSILADIIALATYMDIDIFYHIELKMKYNKFRERLHGKAY